MKRNKSRLVHRKFNSNPSFNQSYGVFADQVFFLVERLDLV